MAFAASATAQPVSNEIRTARYLDSIRDNGAALYAFLRQMPKGGDVHSHLSGTVYAESFIRWAAEDGGCVVRATRTIINAPCSVTGDTVPAARAASDGNLYGALIDALSMRNWDPTRVSGHDHFFATFGRAGVLPRRVGDMLAEASARAESGGVSYLELMYTPDSRPIRAAAQAVRWTGDPRRMRDTLLALGFERAVPVLRARLDTVEARRDTVLACGESRANRGCAVTARWLYQVPRAAPPEMVFTHILAGFLLVRADPRVVGLNLVQPEDNPVAMADYSLHMRMIGFLRTVYPDVRVTLHAGELALGLVPPEGLRTHIREAVLVAGAVRIGHGVAVMYEDQPHALLAEMARRRVMVEINLSSNDYILGIRGRDHPLRSYIGAGVPFALSTDDEGVARSEMTMEYVRGARDQRLTYRELKMSARNSLHYAFVEGESLWADLPAVRMVPDCAAARGGLEGPSCSALVGRSTKARLQRDLELGFRRFEAKDWQNGG